jgi:hypothetical protein
VFNNDSDESEFEGFTNDDVEEVDAHLENLRSAFQNEILDEDSDDPFSTDDSETDPGSPGH